MNALFWIMGGGTVALASGLIEYHRWQWASKLMAEMEHNQ